MKKLLYCAAALAAVFFAGSCQRENLEPVAGGNTVTYTVQLPDVIGTKVGEDVTAVNELVYEVYRTEATSADDYSLTGERLFHKITSMQDGRATINFELVNSQNYRVLFWAHVEGNGVYTTSDLTNVSLTQALDGNTENYAAFAGTDYIKDGDALTGRTITLVRPVAQLNIGTSEESLDVEGQTDVEVTTTAVTVNGLSTTFNVSNLQAGAISAADFVYSAAETPDTWGPLTVNSVSYRYLSMNYVGFAPQSGTTVEVEYTINTENVGTINNTINNVPVKANYRTNIVGNLITSKTSYIVDLQEDFYDTDGGNMYVENEGVVKNVNGAYEVSNANGLAYAINNLFAQGGDFYLTAAEYDMTGFVLNPVTVEEGKTLNLYGETPIVTRAATSIGSVIIKGLNQPLISKVEGELSVSGLDIPTADNTVSVLIDNVAEGANVVVSDVNVDKVANTGAEHVFTADEVASLEALNASLASGVKVINLTEDIEAPKVIFIDRSVVINGNENTFTTSDKRAFRLIASGIEVTFNNLDIVSKAVRVGNTDVRGVSIDGTSEKTGEMLENITLTLNNCSHDFTDKSANDWAYAVNVVGGKGYKVTVNGGTYEGANVINVWGENHSISVDGAVLTSLYPANDYYYGYCISLQEATGCTLNVANTIFNGSNAIAYIKDDNNNTVIAKNNTDNTMYYKNTDDGAVFNVSSVEKLQEAINMAKPETTVINFTNDIEGDVTLVQKQGVKITIDGYGYKYNGTIKVHSNSNHYADAALTVQNVNFETSTASANLIEALENGSQRYSTNITVKDCSFTATGDAMNTAVGVQIKSSKWAKVIHCTAKDMHSLLQAQSCDETVVLEDCTINGKNGVAFKQVKAATVEGTSINASGYGIRFDGNTDNYGITVNNNNVTAAQPFIVRRMTGKNNTITLGENTLTTEGLYQIVLTNGEDDAAYEVPTGTYTLTGADEYVVYPKVVYVENSDQFMAAIAKENNVVTLVPGMEYLLNKKIGLAKGVTIHGNGASIKNDWGSNLFNKQTTLENVTIEDVNFTNNTILDMAYAKGSVAFKNCVFSHERGNQSAHFDGQPDAKVTFDNCTLYGRNMLASALAKVVFNNCNILESTWNTEQGNKGVGTGWSGVNMWGKYEFNACQFDPACQCMAKTDGVEADFNGCSVTDGSAIENVVIYGSDVNKETVTIRFN